MPPARPADLILASMDKTGVALPAALNKGAGAVAPHDSLPPVITAGVDRAPTGALALAEASLPAQKDDDSALLARAAELTAPLPPMPIPMSSQPRARRRIRRTRLRKRRRDGGAARFIQRRRRPGASPLFGQPVVRPLQDARRPPRPLAPAQPQ